MTDLVAEVTEQRAVGLVQLQSAPFALGIVGLGGVERDHAARMSGQYRRRSRLLGAKFIRQSALRVLPRGW